MKKGFTLIELLAVIVILAIIALIASPIIIGLIDNVGKESFKDSAYGIVKAGEMLYSQGLLNGTNEEVTFTYSNGIESNVDSKKLNYNGSKPNNGTVLVNGEGRVAIAIHNGTYCAKKGYFDSEVILTEETIGNCNVPLYVDASGASSPKLTTGMIPVKWDGTNWVKADLIDKWYDYSTKEWANVITVTSTNRATHLSALPGSIIPMSDINAMWVWIPRYIYKISTGWHNNVTGTIDLQFSKGIDDNWNKASIGNVNLNESANASNNTWTNHPAFTFGDTELTGLWVAKFEVSGTTAAIDIKPNVVFLRGGSIGNQFTGARNMETNSRYGWETTGDNIDTHLMKNIEWGAVAYLSKSIYGKNEEIWLNNSGTYKTGCSANGTEENAYSGCENTYDTVNGQQASTTGNIYGVYDMNGGAWEYTAAYVDNDNDNLIINGSSLIAADDKYKDIYEKAPIDSDSTNYTLTINKKGDAVYETSNLAVYSGSWYTSSSLTPNNSSPWFIRGGGYNNGGNAGIFNFMYDTRPDYADCGFRVVLLVGSGL